MKKFFRVATFIFVSLLLNVNAYAYDLIYPKLIVKRPLQKTDYIVIQQEAHEEKVEALYEAGLRYSLGYTRRLDMHIDVDYEKSLEFFERAYKKGHAESAYFLGVMKFKGRGTEKDYNKAIECFKFASEKGIYQANIMLSLVSYELYKVAGKLEFYKPDYLKDAKTLTTKEVERKEPVSLYNLAVMKLETEEFCADLDLKLSDLLYDSVKGFAKTKDEENALKALKILREKNLSRRRDTQRLFNKEFLGKEPVDLSPSVVY